MDAWLPFRVDFLAESPVHIGSHDLGMIRRTRYYVPARVVWGAVTSHLSPSLAKGLVPPQMYKVTRSQVGQCLRTTHFFPVFGGEECTPIFDPGCGLRYGRYREEALECLLVSSQTTTALAPESLTAEPGALHETEFLSPRSRSGGKLGFRGYVILRGIEPDLVWDALAKISVGADRHYGWGRLAMDGHPQQQGQIFSRFRVLGWDGPDPVVEQTDVASGVPSHVIAEKEQSSCYGDLEVVGGLDWDAGRGAGQERVENRLCWAPGSRFPAGTRFSIEPEGVWRVATGSPKTDPRRV